MKKTWRELASVAGYPKVSDSIMAHRLKSQFRALNAEQKATFILEVRFLAGLSKPFALEEALTKLKRDGVEEWQQTGAVRLMDLLFASPFARKSMRCERVPRLSSTTGSGGFRKNEEGAME